MGIAYILTVVLAPPLTNPNRRRYQIVHKLSPHDGTLSTDCYHLRCYSDTSEYLPYEGTANGYVRLLEIYEAHEERHSCLPPKFLQPAHHKHLQAIEDTIQTSHRYPGGSERASRSYSKVIGTGCGNSGQHGCAHWAMPALPAEPRVGVAVFAGGWILQQRVL